MSIGGYIAAQYFPGGFDWPYTVASALMSQKHNPDGSFWFAASFSLSMLLLWPYVSSLQQRLATFRLHSTRLLITVLRVGLLGGMLLGLEGLFIYDVSHWLYKAHELLALLTFLTLYTGILGLLILCFVLQPQRRWRTLLVVIPLVAISTWLLWLYLSQHDLGWVDTSWRDRGIPVWLSFAFWQWWLMVFLWLGMGILNRVVMK